MIVETVAPGTIFWIIAAGCSRTQSKEGHLHVLKSRVGDGRGLSQEGSPPVKFDVPDGEHSLKFGSFDNLIRLTDDLQKADSQVEATLRRLERHSLEVDPESQFFVISQRQRVPLERYIRNWQWDDAKYPKSRGISENCGVLLVNVGKLDDEARNKMAQYSDLRAQAASVGKKNESASLVTRELVDLLTPTLVRTEHNHTDDFIYSERMTTVLVVIPRGCEDEFLKCYENFPDADEVVPMSAKQFRGVDDRDGNSLWRVVMFKASVEPFKKACKARRFVTRDFTYSEENYRKLVAQRGQLEDEAAKQHRVIKSVFQATWSDVMVAWVHLKAMRIFVESVLRFGVPPHFAAFILSPKKSQTSAMRKALADIFTRQGSSAVSDEKLAEAAEADGEEYFPYVSLSFMPLASQGH